LGNPQGIDISPFVTDAAGTWSIAVKPPFDGYSGNYDFELVDIASAAMPANLDEEVTVNFPSGREAKVVAFDIVAGQRIYYDAINPNPTPEVSVRLLSPSGGDQWTLSAQLDNNSVGNFFGALQFRETGKYYVVITGEQDAAFDFNFRMVDVDVAPKITLGSDVTGVNDPAGRADIYRLDGVAGQILQYDSFINNRHVNFGLYGPGGSQVSLGAVADDHVIVLPETGTYTVYLDSSAFANSAYGFRLIDLQSLSTLPQSTPTTVHLTEGRLVGYQFSGTAADNLTLELQSVSLPGRTSYTLLDRAGNETTFSVSGNRLSAKLLTTGLYSLLLRTVGNEDVSDVTFSASITSGPSIVKSGFNLAQTLTISAGGSASFQFSAPAGTRIVVDGLDNVNENLYVELNAPDGARLYTGFGFAGELQDVPRYGPAFLPQSGTYTITLRGSTATDAGSYRFRVLDLDTFATPLSLGTVIKASFPTGRETLVYSFDATVGDQLLFDAQSGGYIFGIYDSQLIATWGRGIFGAASTAESDGISRILRTGRHYVVFHGDPSIPADFSFQIHNLLTAPSLALGAEATGIIENNNQVVYRMHLESGQRIRLDHLSPYDIFNYTILNSGGRVLLNSGFQAIDSGPPSVPFLVVAETGNYYVAVQSRQVAAQNYRFRIDDLATAPERPLTQTCKSSWIQGVRLASFASTPWQAKPFK
jgi:large repetitive protein